MSDQPTIEQLGEWCRTALSRLFDETRRTPEFPAEVRNDAVEAVSIYVGALLGELRRHAEFRERAAANIAKWGAQDYETLALCIAEEAGEVAQAVLQFQHENGAEERIREEAVDLGALCLQLLATFDVAKAGVDESGSCEVCRFVGVYGGADRVLECENEDVPQYQEVVAPAGNCRAFEPRVPA